MDYIRRAFSVPAKRGGRVTYTGSSIPQEGTITGATDHSLRIRLDGYGMSMCFHPTYCLKYHDAKPQEEP